MRSHSPSQVLERRLPLPFQAGTTTESHVAAQPVPNPPKPRRANAVRLEELNMPHSALSLTKHCLMSDDADRGCSLDCCSTGRDAKLHVGVT